MKRFTILIVLLPIVFALNIKTFHLQMEIFSNDTVVLKELSVIPSTESDFPKISTNYKIRIYSYDDLELWSANLPVYFYVNLEEMGLIKLEKALIDIRTPYFENAKSIVIFHKEREIGRFEISKYVCKRNNVCDFGESRFNCPKDCGITEIMKFVAVIMLIIIFISYFAMKKILKHFLHT